MMIKSIGGRRQARLELLPKHVQSCHATEAGSHQAEQIARDFQIHARLGQMVRRRVLHSSHLITLLAHGRVWSRGYGH